MHPLVTQLNAAGTSDISWDYEDTDQLVPKEIVRVTERFNTTPFHALVLPLREAVTTDSITGIDYLLIKQAHDSRTTAVVHFNPFGNGMTDGMLLRAAYLHDVFDECGLRDMEHKTLPLLSFASPTANRGVQFTRKHRRHAAKGNFKTMAEQYISVIASWGYTRLHIVGFSQGATLAAAVAAAAPMYGIEVVHLAIGEPANVIRRTRRQLGRDFAASAGYLEGAVHASGLKHLQHSRMSVSKTRYIRGMLPQARLTMSLVKGMGRPTASIDIAASLDQGTAVTLSWGSLNVISPPEALQKISEEHGHNLHTVEIIGGHHAWGDRLNLLALFYTYSLLR